MNAVTSPDPLLTPQDPRSMLIIWKFCSHGVVRTRHVVHVNVFLKFLRFLDSAYSSCKNLTARGGRSSGTYQLDVAGNVFQVGRFIDNYWWNVGKRKHTRQRMNEQVSMTKRIQVLECDFWGDRGSVAIVPDLIFSDPWKKSRSDHLLNFWFSSSVALAHGQLVFLC